LALAGWRFETPSADEGFTAHPVPFELHPHRTGQAQPKLIDWCLTTQEVGVLLLPITFRAFVTAVTPMPSADFCRPVTRDCSRVSLLRDKQQISRGKSNRFQRTTAGFTNSALDGSGLRSTVQTRPTLHASIRFLSIGSRLCFHTSFRPLLAETPLRFAITSRPSGCERDFHPLAVKHARHTRPR
jgi:hypothetical protein